MLQDQTTQHTVEQNQIDDLYDGPSKSQVKRELLAILDLGKEVINLPLERVKQLNLDEKLFEAIVLAQKTTGRGGKKRQIHYVGKLMRNADTAAIRQQLDSWQYGSKQATAHMHRLETLRTRLIESDQEMTRLIDEYPTADVQQIRTLIRAARKEQAQNQALTEAQDHQKKHYRALFQALKTLIAE